MHPGDIVARIVAFDDQADPEDEAAQDRRRRRVFDLQQVLAEVCNHRPWAFMIKTGTLTVPAGSYDADLPADFGNFPKLGGAFSGTVRLMDVDYQIIQNIHQGAWAIGGAYVFTQAGFNETTRRHTVRFGTMGPLSIPIYYKRKIPHLADRPWSGYPVVTPSAGTTNLASGVAQFKVTYVTDDGFEHEPGDAVAATFVAGAADTPVVDLPDPGPHGTHYVRYINLYRTIIGGSVYYQTLQRGYKTVLTGVVDPNDDAALVLLPPLVEQSPLQIVPEDYHETVLYAGTMARSKKAKGDSRDWAAEYRQGKAEMVVKERLFQPSLQQMPRSGFHGLS